MIYLDNSATTPIDREVYEAMIPFLTNEYGNPSSKYYGFAIRAKEAVEESRYHVAKLINANPEEIVFTAGATESTNMIIKGVADYKKYYQCTGNHIITSAVEHKATINTCRFLNGDIYSNNDAMYSLSQGRRKVDRGYEVSFLEVNEFGQVEIDTLANAILPQTVLVSLLWGNNEIGTLNDILALGDICKNKGVLFHSDATQVLGKIDIDIRNTPVDFLSFSAHKIYGPKGIGAAFIKGDAYGLPPFTSLLHGGEQENGLRAGTLAVHDIVGFGKAAEIALRNMEQQKKHTQEIEDLIVAELAKVSFINLISKSDFKVPGILSIIIDKPSFNNERFVKKVSDKLALSTGSACTAGQPSHVLMAIGKGEYTSNVLRISFGRYIDKETAYHSITNLIEELNKNVVRGI